LVALALFGIWNVTVAQITVATSSRPQQLIAAPFVASQAGWSPPRWRASQPAVHPMLRVQDSP